MRRIGISTGYLEEFWKGWPFCDQYGGSEHMVVEIAAELAAQGHEVTVRLPRAVQGSLLWRGVQWVSLQSEPQRYDRLFCFDDFERRDSAAGVALVACRSDPPPHTDFDQLIFLSRHHAKLMGHPDSPFVGGGVSLADYRTDQPRLARRVIYASSPDRGGYHAQKIGRAFDYLALYGGLTRADLVLAQQTAQALIHPCDPRRPSEFFCMAVLEAMAAGTPCLISDADALPELWGDAAKVLDRPITYADWADSIETLLNSRTRWQKYQRLGRLRAKDFDWPIVAGRYLALL